jgi:tetratricopeptide (TPR) repeat protein
MRSTHGKIALFFIILILLLVNGCGKENKDFASLKQDGEKALGSGNYNDALEILRKAYLLNPSDRDILFYLGTVFRKLDQTDSSVAYFKRARILYPRDRDINRELLSVCRLTNDYEGALRAIASLIVTGDNEQGYWPLIAELNYRKKDYEQSLYYYSLLLKEFPEEKNYYMQTSGIKAQLGQFDESNEILKKAIEKFGPSPESYANMAINFLSMKDITAGEEYLRKSLSLAPDNIPVWVNLANVLSEQKDPVKKKEALEIFKKYQEKIPKAFNADSMINSLQLELGNR